MNITLHVWRQKGPETKGKLVTYPMNEIDPNMSFIELLDELNRKLIEKNEEPVAFDCDCLEGICGACSLMINGIAHGPDKGTTTCQLHMRRFSDGDHITVEPWRARAFPVVKDLVVDRSSFDRIVQTGGFISVRTGGTPDGNALPVGKEAADTAMDAAACIGCGACVASCKNGSAMLFVAAQVARFNNLPQGFPEKTRRVLNLVTAMDKEGFGACTNQYECEAVCPKEISVKFISDMNRQYFKAALTTPASKVG